MVTTLPFQDIKVPAPGYGLMSLSGAYGAANDEESLKLMAKVVESGCTFWDTAKVYGQGHNEELIGRFLKENPGAREKVFIASKCGFTEDGSVTNDPDYILKSIDESTKRLGTKPDLYYLHRIDPNTPLDKSIKTLQSLKESGKTRYIGLSECGPETLKKACGLAHIDALQIEYSPWFTEHEETLIPTAKSLGVTVIAFSPLGRGVLTGRYRDASAFAGDWRSEAERFSTHFDHNFKLVQEFEKLASKKGCTAGQLSMAWIMSQGAIPIPGTRNEGRFEENWGATNVKLMEEDLAELKKIMKEQEPTGARYNAARQAMIGH